MKFSDYESSYITPQYTLLEKLNLILKFLENSQLEISIVDVDFDTDTGTGNLNDTQVKAIQSADFVRCRNRIFVLAGRFDFHNGVYYYHDFTNVNSGVEGDVYLFQVDIRAKTFTITGGLG